MYIVFRNSVRSAQLAGARDAVAELEKGAQQLRLRAERAEADLQRERERSESFASDLWVAQDSQAKAWQRAEDLEKRLKEAERRRDEALKRVSSIECRYAEAKRRSAELEAKYADVLGMGPPGVSVNDLLAAFLNIQRLTEITIQRIEKHKEHMRRWVD